MNIVHVETGLHLYGGARQVAYLAEGMARRGHDIRLVCPPGAAIAEACRGQRGLRVVELRCAGDADFGFAQRLAALLRAEPADIVHLHSRRGADGMGGLGARMADVPAVLSRRVDNREPRLLVPLKYALYRRVICISEGIAAVLRDCGVAPDKLRVVRSALDPLPWRHPRPLAEFDAAFNISAGCLRLGIVAQLIERKGHRVLFEALASPDLPDWRLVVFGQGPLRDALGAEAERLGIADRVRFAGFRDDLPDWIGHLDLLVHPASMEGLGIALLQASAAGVPILACRAGGMPEAVADEVSGLLVPPHDVGALRAALRRLMTDAALRARLGQAGSARIDAEFSVDAMVEGNLAVYRELVGG